MGYVDLDTAMRIYMLPVPGSLQPKTQGFIWPPGSDDYGVEQDFVQWLLHSGLITEDPVSATWHYAPVYWNRYWWQNLEDHRGQQLNESFQPALLDRSKTFTICEYDPISANVELDLSGITVFSASRREDNRCIDIPLLLGPHRLRGNVQKRWLAVFIGNYSSDGNRSDMATVLQDRPDCFISGEGVGIDEYVYNLQSAWIGLAPRGVGAQSFRFYESMQAGTVPLYISDLDARPFKDWIDWPSYSLYRRDNEGLPAYLDSLDRTALEEMGTRAQWLWNTRLSYGLWCRYVIKELERL